MKKRLLVLILILSIFIISGCQYYSSSPVNKETQKDVEFGREEKVIETTDKLTKKDGLSTVNLYLPTGVYEDKDGNEFYVQNDDSTNTLDLTPGYIIEFEKPSLVEKKLILEKERLTEPEINNLLASHKEELSQDHEEFKSLASQRLGKDINSRKRKEFFGVYNGISLDISSVDAKKLENLQEVKRIIENGYVEANLIDSIPLIQANEAWNLGYTGEGVTVAIIDTGIDYTHPDLGGCFGPGCKVEGGYDIVNDDSDPMDDAFHGTHCAGIVASEDSNSIGIKGVAPDATLYAYKVLDQGGSGWWDWVIAGIEMATDPNQDGDTSDHLDVISLSLGGWGNPEDPVSIAVDNSFDAGVVIVVAAGNDGSYGSIGSPGTARNAITIGATYKKDYNAFWWECEPGEWTRCGQCELDGRVWCEYWQDGENPEADQITSFSSRGPVIGDTYGLVKPDVVAPGAIICSSRYDEVFMGGEDPYYHPCLDEDHVQVAGTSMSAPHVAGLAALIIGKNGWTPDEVKATIRNSASNLYNQFGYDINTQGYGRINVSAAMNLTRPPIAQINTSGKFSGSNLPIIGTAESDNFLDYALYYTNNYQYHVNEPHEWNVICTGNQEVIEDTLCDWNISSIQDGEYTLKLIANGNNQQSLDYVYIKKKNTEIKSPLDLSIRPTWDNWKREILPTWKDVTIVGTSFKSDFEYYSLEWRPRYVGEWTSEGIYLTNEGLHPIIEGTLGTFDLSVIEEPGFYELKLRTFGSNSYPDLHIIEIYIETNLHEGWPIDLTNIGGSWMGLSFLDQPTISDINKDGKKDLIISYENLIKVLDENGNSLPGWPKENEVYCGQEAIMQQGAAVSDLDNDGYNEIVIGDNCGYLHIFNHDGSYFIEPKSIGGYLESPVIKDIDDDGTPEIILTDWNTKLHVVDIEGNHLPNWPKFLGAPEGYDHWLSIFSSPIVSDLNNDGDIEIITHTRGYNSFDSETGEVASSIWILDANGNPLPGWPKELFGSEGTNYYSNIIVSDIDDDRDLEIISGSSGFWGEEFAYVYAWELDGSDVEGWPILTGIEAFDVSAGDINNDGEIEIIVTAENPEPNNWNSCIFVYNSLGQLLNNFPVCEDDEEGIEIYTGFHGHPIISDLDLDNNLEINVGTDGGSALSSDNYLVRYYAINDDGSIVNEFYKMTDDMSFGNTIPVSDIDNDGKNELFVSTWGDLAFVWDTNGQEVNNQWPVYQQDELHTGLYPPQQISCENSTSTTCGDTFPPDCSSIGQPVCCGDDSGESYLDKDCADSSIFADSCYDNSEDNACCDDTKDCVYEGTCYTRNRAEDYRDDIWEGTNDAGTIGYYKCLNTPGMIFDCDHDPYVCEEFDWACNVDETRPYNRAAGWAFEGEDHIFGGYGDTWGRGIGVWGAYDWPHLVTDGDFEECCGDDQGEYLISGNGHTRCCNHPNDKVDASGKCIAQGKPKPVSAIPRPPQRSPIQIQGNVFDWLVNLLGLNRN